jgi:hypothetical protein
MQAFRRTGPKLIDGGALTVKLTGFSPFSQSGEAGTMRTLILSLVFAAPAVAEHRTWTIARDVYTAEAELVAVRGDTVYLRFGEKVESIPLERLSVADQRYIGSLALAPVEPGPAAENPVAQQDSGPLIVGPSSGDVLPLPADDYAPGEEHSLIVPASGTTPAGQVTASPAVAEESLPNPPGQTLAPPTAQGAPRSLGTYPNQNFGPGVNPQPRRPPQPPANDRRTRRQQAQQQQAQQQQNARGDNSDRDNNEESRGFLRRFQRQR